MLFTIFNRKFSTYLQRYQLNNLLKFLIFFELFTKFSKTNTSTSYIYRKKLEEAFDQSIIEYRNKFFILLLKNL